MDKFDRLIRAIFGAGTLYECGCRLEEFASAMERISDPGLLEDVSDRFWVSLTGRSAIDLDFEDSENRGWLLCPPTAQMATYLDLFLITQPTPEEDVTFLLAAARELQQKFDGKRHPVPDMDTFQAVMDFLDKKYSYSDLVLGRQRAVVMFFPDGKVTDGNQCVVRYYSEPGLLCPHFPFFGLSGMDRFMDALMSPAFNFLFELAVVMVTAAFAVYVDGRMEYIIPPELVRLMAESGDHKGVEEMSAHGQAYELVKDLQLAMLADSPFPAPMMDLSIRRMPDKYRSMHRLLDAVLEILKKKKRDNYAGSI